MIPQPTVSVLSATFVPLVNLCHYLGFVLVASGYWCYNRRNIEQVV